MAQTITQLTLAWLIATIEATRAGLAGNLAQTPVADWGAAPVREVRNHEQDLHTAMQVLGDMLNQRGAFAASGIPAAPHLERVPAYVCGVDLSAEGLADLKKALADPRRGAWGLHVERMPAPALNAKDIAANVCRRVAELPDRNSPEDWPEAMLVTGQELIDVVMCEITQAMETAPHALAVPLHLGTPPCAGHSMPLGGNCNTIDADTNEGA